MKLETPSVCPVKFHRPVVASLSMPGPVMKAVPIPDRTKAVGETKSMCNELRLKEYVFPNEMNVHSGLMGVLAPTGFQVNGVIVTTAPDVPA